MGRKLGVYLWVLGIATVSVVFMTGIVAGSDAGDTDVTLAPTNTSVTPDNTTTYDIVVTDASGGIGALNLTVSVENSNVATIERTTYAGTPSYTRGSSTDTRSHLIATGMDTLDSGRVEVASVTVRGTDTGQTDLSLTVTALGNETGHSYQVDTTTGGTLVIEPTNDTQQGSDSGDNDDGSDGGGGDNDTGSGSSGGDGGGGGGGGGSIVSPAVFNVALSANEQQVKPGDPVTVTARVENLGENSGTFDAIWTVDGRTEQRNTRVLSGSAVRTFTLNHTFTDVGNHTINFADRKRMNITVSQQPTTTTQTTATPTTQTVTTTDTNPTTSLPATETPAADQPTASPTSPTKTTTGSGPGFDVSIAIVALLGSIALARIRL